jgi:hypothetical protein
MGRVALSQKIKTALVVLAIVAISTAGIVTAVVAESPSHEVKVSVNSQNQTTDIKYNGVEGQTALALLKKHAEVTTKHYSFGDLVTSINGTAGNGPKYWTFYLNGKEASVGAGAYVSKNSDKIEWRLQ